MEGGQTWVTTKAGALKSMGEGQQHDPSCPPSSHRRPNSTPAQCEANRAGLLPYLPVCGHCESLSALHQEPQASPLVTSVSLAPNRGWWPSPPFPGSYPHPSQGHHLIFVQRDTHLLSPLSVKSLPRPNFSQFQLHSAPGASWAVSSTARSQFHPLLPPPKALYSCWG